MLVEGLMDERPRIPYDKNVLRVLAELILEPISQIGEFVFIDIRAAVDVLLVTLGRLVDLLREERASDTAIIRHQRTGKLEEALEQYSRARTSRNCATS